MTTLGIDSDAPVNPALMGSYQWIGRYLAPHSNPLTRTELVAYTAAKKGVVLLCEHTVTDVNGGAESRTANPKQWVASAHTIGACAGAVLISARDEDPTTAIEECAIGYYKAFAATVRNAHFLAGAYGGHDLMVSVSPLVGVPPCPNHGASGSHPRWTTFRGSGQRQSLQRPSSRLCLVVSRGAEVQVPNIDTERLVK